MIYPGYIRIIDNKIKFEYHTFPKPHINTCEYKINLKKYLASKRVIDVRNECIDIPDFGNIPQEWQILIKGKRYAIKIENGQNCEAKVKNNVAVIIKID